MNDTDDSDAIRHYTAADGATLAYRRSTPEAPADGPALVLLHGAASNGTRWWHFVDHCALRENTRLLRPDLRGHGASVWRGPARMTHWVDDLVALLDHEGIERAVVLGHCLGANIALHFAARYARRCAGLVLVEPMLRPALRGPLARIRRIAPLLDALARLAGLCNRIGMRRRRLRQVDLRALDQPVHEARRRGEAVDDALRVHGSLRHDLGVVPTGQLLANFVELMREPAVDAVRSPSLVLQSSGTGMTDAALTARRLASLPDADFVELPAEHWIPAAYPERLCELVEQWWAGAMRSSHPG